MASIDHTARARSSARNELDGSTLFSDHQLYPLSPEQEGQLTDSDRASGTALAMLVIEGLLKYSDACERANVRANIRSKQQGAISPWPLIPSQRSGLHAALYYLHDYVEMLLPEADG
jgi:hypothetical protein